MKHRHLNHECLTLAAIDDILDRGHLPDWLELFACIDKDPFGPVAQRIEEVAQRGVHYGRDALVLKKIERVRGASIERVPGKGKKSILSF